MHEANIGVKVEAMKYMWKETTSSWTVGQAREQDRLQLYFLFSISISFQSTHLYNS